MGETIIPDSNQSNEGIKINLKNLFTFLSSLDYIKTIELSNALDTIDSKQFFFTGEKQSIILFAYTHTSFWIFIGYIVLLLTSNLVFEIQPIYGILIVSLIWMLFGFWFVNRYTWGNGYLWQVAKDFMIHVTIATILISIATDVVIYYLIPYVYDYIVNWLSSGPKDGYLNAFAESALIWLQSIAKPISSKINVNLQNFLAIYSMISIFKIFSFSVPTLFMFYFHKRRKDLKKRLDELLEKIA